MVLDEELKMMATVAEHGGQVVGPYLKQMAHLTHTEYLLAGRGSLDVREVLRETMFAPTVTGSPIENACRVIARHERRGRGYYAGVLALLGHDDGGPADAGRADPDPHRGDLARTARLRVPVGATLVRHSTAGRRGRRDPHQGGRGAGRARACGPRAAPPASAAGAAARRRSRRYGPRWPPATTGWPGSGWTTARAVRAEPAGWPAGGR